MSSIATPTAVYGKSACYSSFFNGLDLMTYAPKGQKTMCFTYAKNNIYKPHSLSGSVGTTASSYLARRKRI